MFLEQSLQFSVLQYILPLIYAEYDFIIKMQ